MKMQKILITALTTILASASFAEIWLPKIFSDNMVLQSGEPVKIWGRSLPNAKIDIRMGEITAETKADVFGKWSANLPSMRANCKDRVMHISENGEAQKKIRGVVVGQVWITGGQSNMQWQLRASHTAKEAVARANYPLMRYFNQNVGAIATKPQEDSPANSKWTVCTPTSCGTFSAVGFYFAEKLMQDLKVPVGLIQTELGGARMIAMLSKQASASESAYDKNTQEYDKLAATYNYEKAQSAYKVAIKKYNEEKAAAKAAKKSFNKRAPNAPFKEGPMRPQEMPAFQYNAKVAPIAGYTAKGFLWYQGESDSGDNANFAAKFEKLIKSWRQDWGKSDMPFYFVQLTSFETRSDWAQTRWEQFKVADKMSNVEMAVIIDLGEQKDIHPKNKLDVGLRLEKIAMKKLYGKSCIEGEYGPMFDGAKFRDNKVIIDFDMYGKKLVMKGNAKGLQVKVFNSWEEPTCVNVNPDGTLTLTSPEASEITEVRYLWKSWAQPDICLYNDEGLPAMPFMAVKKVDK